MKDNIAYDLAIATFERIARGWEDNGKYMLEINQPAAAVVYKEVASTMSKAMKIYAEEVAKYLEEHDL